MFCLSFVQNIKQMFLFFPWGLVLHWHPSAYSNRCDFDLIFTSVNGCKKTFVPVVSRFGGEHKNKRSWGCWFQTTSPLITVSLFVLCCYLLLCRLAFASSMDACFREPGDRTLSILWRKNILLWLHKQVIRFLGGRMNAIILGTRCACSIAILVI